MARNILIVTHIERRLWTSTNTSLRNQNHVYYYKTSYLCLLALFWWHCLISRGLQSCSDPIELFPAWTMKDFMYCAPMCRRSWVGAARRFGIAQGHNQTAKQSVFSSKSVKKSVTRGVRVLCAQTARASHARTPVWRVRRERKNVFFSVSPQSRSLFSASFHTFCLTARAYLNTQKCGLFCSLGHNRSFFLWE